MILENQFEVPLAPADAWAVLLDVPGIVGCVPGAELVSIEEDGTFKGKISVKLGPLALSFHGTVRIDSVDQDNRTALVHAKGADQKGRGNAGATTRMMVSPASDGSLVHLETDLHLSGMIAQYGRAQGMIAAMANEIVSQFAEALRHELTEKGPVSPAGLDAPARRPPSAIGLSVLWRGLTARSGDK